MATFFFKLANSIFSLPICYFAIRKIVKNRCPGGPQGPKMVYFKS